MKDLLLKLLDYFEESFTRYCTYETSDMSDAEYTHLCNYLLSNINALGDLRRLVSYDELSSSSGIYPCHHYTYAINTIKATYETI